MNISDFDYNLPDERIAKFPVGNRDASKLLVWRGGNVIARNGVTKQSSVSILDCFGQSPRNDVNGLSNISETTFADIGSVLPPGSLLIFNNTRVVRARLVMHRPSGARVEILCLEPVEPADYEHAFAAKVHCEWSCMIGNLKKWKSGPVEIPFIYNGSEYRLLAWRNVDVIARNKETKQSESETPDCFGQSPRNDGDARGEHIVRFEWGADLAFGELLELLGRMPIPPYLGRDSEEIDNTRYQTVYARNEGSVAAPTAGLHFTPGLISNLHGSGIETDEVTLHVGAGTFLPVKTENALHHPMHTEHFEVTLATIEHLLAKGGHTIAVGTTSVRTLESLTALGWRISQTGSPEADRPVGQFEPYDIPADFDGRTALETLAEYMRTRGLDKLSASTRIMITPGFTFRIVGGIVTNFHQPKSTLLLLISAFTQGDEWRRIYDYALAHDFRFLSYGDSSLLLRGV